MFGNITSATSSTPAAKPASTPPRAMSRDEVKMLESLAKHEPEQAKNYFASYPDKVAPFAAASPEVAAKLGIASKDGKEAAPKPAQEVASPPATKPASADPNAISKDENAMLLSLAKHGPKEAKAYFASHPEKAAAFAAANPEVATKLGIAPKGGDGSSSKLSQDATAISAAAVNGQSPKALDPKLADATSGMSVQECFDLVKKWQSDHPDTTASAAKQKAETPASSKPQASTGEHVTVVKGDTLSKMAARLGVSLADLKAANPGLCKEGVDGQGHHRKANGDLIYPGDVVKNPKTSAKPHEQDSVQAAGAAAPAQGVEAQQRKQVEIYRATIEKQVSAKLGHEVKIHLEPQGAPRDQVALLSRVLGSVSKDEAKGVSQINLKVDDSMNAHGSYEVNLKEKALEIVFHAGGSVKPVDKAPAGEAVTKDASSKQAADAQSHLIQNLKNELAKLAEQDKLLASEITPFTEASVAAARRQMQGLSPKGEEPASKSAIAMAKRQLLGQQMGSLTSELKIAEGFKVPAEASPKDAAALAGILGQMSNLVPDMANPTMVSERQAKLAALGNLLHNPGLYDATKPFFTSDPAIVSQAGAVVNLQNRIGRLMVARDDLLPDLADPKKKAVAQAQSNMLQGEIGKLIELNYQIRTYQRPSGMTADQAAKQAETLRKIDTLAPQLIDPETGSAAAALIEKELAALKAESTH